jgi:NADH-quinone oxidoreductase subunit C
MTATDARTLIAERFPDARIASGAGAAESIVVTVPVEQWAALAAFAKETLGCRYFAFETAVDWKDEGLEVVARVDNLDDRVAVTMKTRLGPGVTTCPSLAPIYRGADWMERECYDMFGISFEGHPDLRRILLAEDWDGHPLLKSYPVDAPHPPYR